jgi:hypothetical protein
VVDVQVREHRLDDVLPDVGRQHLA